MISNIYNKIIKYQLSFIIHILFVVQNWRSSSLIPSKLCSGDVVSQSDFHRSTPGALLRPCGSGLTHSQSYSLSYSFDQVSFMKTISRKLQIPFLSAPTIMLTSCEITLKPSLQRSWRILSRLMYCLSSEKELKQCFFLFCFF